MHMVDNKQLELIKWKGIKTRAFERPFKPYNLYNLNDDPKELNTILLISHPQISK